VEAELTMIERAERGVEARMMQLLRVLIAVAGLVTLARAETRPPYGGTVEGSLLGAPVTFDPVAAQSHAEVTVVGLVFDTLYAVGPDGVVPHLALGLPSLDAARTTAHIALRRGVRFHDQAVMVAADVVDSLERVRHKVGWLLAPVASVRAAGDGIDVALHVPGVDLAPLLALPQTAITRRGQPPAARPIGSGPFAVDTFDREGKCLVLKAFDEHFAGRPYLHRIEFSCFYTSDGEARRFETGVAQLSARGAAAFAGATPKYPASRVDSPAALLVFVGFGRRHNAVISEPAFRQALDLALDRGALSTITSGERTVPTRLPLPIEAGGAELDAASQAGNPQQALAVLRDAGAHIGALAPAGLQHLSLAIIVDQSRPDDREIALRVSRGLTKLGIGFTIEAAGPGAFRERVQKGDCDLWIGQLAAPVRVPVAWWGAAFAAGNSDWAARQLAVGPIDPASAVAEFRSKLPIVPLMFRSLAIWHRKDVRGLGFDTSGRPGLADLYWFPKAPP
jgi:peptide/nickel transport system substrate-binding protein